MYLSFGILLRGADTSVTEERQHGFRIYLAVTLSAVRKLPSLRFVVGRGGELRAKTRIQVVRTCDVIASAKLALY